MTEQRPKPIKPDAIITLTCKTCGRAITDPRATQCPECIAERIDGLIQRALVREYGK